MRWSSVSSPLAERRWQWKASLPPRRVLRPCSIASDTQFGRRRLPGKQRGINRDVLCAFNVGGASWDEVIRHQSPRNVFVSRLALPGMMRRGSGAICNVVSPARSSRPGRPVQLLGIKRRHYRFHQGTLSRGGAIPHSGECHLPRLIQAYVRQIHCERGKRLLSEIPLGALWQARRNGSAGCVSGSEQASYITDR